MTGRNDRRGNYPVAFLADAPWSHIVPLARLSLALPMVSRPLPGQGNARA
jgi:hypothetical protein